MNLIRAVQEPIEALWGDILERIWYGKPVQHFVLGHEANNEQLLETANILRRSSAAPVCVRHAESVTGVDADESTTLYEISPDGFGLVTHHAPSWLRQARIDISVFHLSSPVGEDVRT